MKKSLYLWFALLALLIIFVLSFCKNMSLNNHIDDNLDNNLVDEFNIEDVLVQVVHIQSKKTVNYIFESESGITIPGNTKSYESILGDGSGIFIRKDGLILTNKHVVSNLDSKYEVVLSDGSSYIANKIWYHDILDLAIIKIGEKDGSDFEKNIISNFVKGMDTIHIGDIVFAIGTLFGKYPQAMTSGIISKKNVSFVYEDLKYKNMLLSDVLVSPGNSGGPLLNDKLEIIGIVTAQDSMGGTYIIPFTQLDIDNFINYSIIN